MRLFHRGLGIPTGPFYHSVPREDDIPIAPMSDDGEGLDRPAPARKPVGPPTLHPGSHVGRLERLTDEPTSLGLYPMRIYELRDVSGLRRENPSGRWKYLVADDAVVAHEVPAWRYFGDHGEGVPEVLEGIWTLDPDRIANLAVPPGEHKFEHIPIPLLQAPKDHPGVRNAFGAVMTWTENRSWAAGQGGGFYYRGCYFTWVVSDPQWLMAMGLAYNAAIALAGGPQIAPDVRADALAAWSALVG